MRGMWDPAFLLVHSLRLIPVAEELECLHVSLNKQSFHSKNFVGTLMELHDEQKEQFSI